MEDTLEIPTFLKVPRKLQRLPHLNRWSRSKPRRPEGQRWIDADLKSVYLYDEAPALGCGYRRVWVSEGRKWCKIASTDGVSKAKLLMAVWAEIVRRMA